MSRAEVAPEPGGAKQGASGGFYSGRGAPSPTAAPGGADPAVAGRRWQVPAAGEPLSPGSSPGVSVIFVNPPSPPLPYLPHRAFCLFCLKLQMQGKPPDIMREGDKRAL